MRILFLSAWYPYPANNGSKLRVYNLLRGLTARHEVTLLSFADEAVPSEPPPELRAICRDVQTVPWHSYNPTSGKSLLALLNPTPRAIVDTYSVEMRDRLRRELDRASYDLVIASQWNTAAYLQDVSGVPALFEEVEIGVLRTKAESAPSPLARLRHRLTLVKLQAYLRRLLPRFAACTVVSEAEATLLSRMVPGYRPIHVVPNAVALEDYAEVLREPHPSSLIFAGSLRYFANHDAMTWFLGEVYPLVQARVPGVDLTLTGDHADLPLPLATNFRRAGFVDDVRPLVASAAISLAPIRLGGGTRLKILEAMALGTPVVSTTKGAEGLDVVDGKHCLLADTPLAFADAVVRLLRDSSLRDELSANGLALVRARYDWRSVVPRFLDLVDSVTFSPV